jgi:F-type H+-transporting ATPase subunit a
VVADLALLAAPEEPHESCHFESGDCGFPAPDAEIFNLEPYATFSVLGLDVHITKWLVLAGIGVVVIVGFFFLAFRSPRLVPRRLQSVGELGYLFVRDQISRQVIGKKGEHFVPFLVSLFFFIWVFNTLAVIPGAQFPVTSRLAFPAALSAMVWLIFNYVGVRKQGFGGYFKNMAFPPGVPKGLYVILTPIELFSTLLVRPFTLAVRLFANMFAGHLLLTTFTVATWYLLSTNPFGLFFSATSFLMTVVLTGFEMFIQALQAFIFTLLAASYISGALEAEH